MADSIFSISTGPIEIGVEDTRPGDHGSSKGSERSLGSDLNAW